MKKILLIPAIAGICLFACSKNNKNDESPTPKPNPTTISAKDPNALTTAITVYHGALVKGEFPAASATGAPLLYTEGYRDAIPAIAGRYAVIPLLLDIPDEQKATTPKGVYVKISGADSYFDIDFSKPITARQAPKQDGPFANNKQYADSVVVIKLPEGISTDTFKVELSIYDAQKKVSNRITVAVVALPVGGGDANPLLLGTWTTNRRKTDSLGEWQPAKVDRIDSAYLVCSNGKMIPAEKSTPGAKKYYVGEYHDAKNEFTLSAAGQGLSDYLKVIKSFDDDKSTCETLVYKDNSYGSKDFFGWSYNNKTQLLTEIYDPNGSYGSYYIQVTRVTIENNKLYYVERQGGVTEYIKK
jgi:hypothetical protein